MRDSMQHGGPDGEGIYVDSELPLALGHRRLSLLDLTEAGHQPMTDLEGALQIVFNGEIYNF
ncbi:MAG: asparagine synthase, partial [Segetibacter sp.]|nr:asparagine synthase [Segetibacter sp.]